ncbi:MAG: caspase family protein [Chitinophagaceae bacterium]
MLFRRVLVTLLLVSLSSVSFSQVEKRFDSLMHNADSVFRLKQYDLSLSRYASLFDLVKANAANGYLASFAPDILLNIGKCLRQLNDLPKAHKYLTNSLLLARVMKFSVATENALDELNELHRYIAANDLAFPYPAVPVTEETTVFFPVSNVLSLSKDSIAIIVHAGKLDGLTDSVQKAMVFQRDSAGKKPWPGGRVLNCYVRKLTDNTVILHAVKDPEFYVSPMDLVYIKTRVPVSWRKLDIAPLVTNGIFFSDNYRQPLYSYRYLYYYADSLTNKDLAAVIRNQVEEVVQAFAADTATNKRYLVKGDRGIFAGENVMLALSHTTVEHIRLFNNFINAYPLKYRGNPFKFSEIYATWVINNTPLAGPDMRPYLLSFPAGSERQRMSANFSSDIRSEELIIKWFNEGMQMAVTDNTDSSQYMALLIRDASAALKDEYNKGWSDYLLAFTEKKLQNTAGAESLFTQSLKKFQAAQNKEGIIWAQNALVNLKKSREIKIQVQSGHLLPYIIAPSPNARYLATAGRYDEFIKVWDMTLGKEITYFPAHTDEINSLHYSPDGRYLISSSDDSTIKVWNAYDYSLLKTIRSAKPEWEAIFSPDNKQIVTGGKDSVIKFIDLASGRVVKKLKLHKGAISSLQFNPADKDILYSCGTDSMVYKWDLTTDKMDHWYREGGKIVYMGISNNGRYMYNVTTEGFINVWDLETPEKVQKAKVNIYQGNENASFTPANYSKPAFSPESRLLVYASHRDTMVIYHLPTNQYRNYFRKPGDDTWFDLAFSNDGNYMVARMSTGGPLRIYNLNNWDFFADGAKLGYRDIKTYYSVPLATQFTPDDNGLVIVDDAIYKADLRNGSKIPLTHGYYSFRNSNILLNDTVCISASTQTPFLYFENLKTHKIIQQFHLGDVSETLEQFEITPDHKTVFLAGSNGTIAAWNTGTSTLLFENKISHEKDPGFYSLRYDSLRKKLYAVTLGDKLFVVDPVNGKATDSLRLSNPSTVEVTPEYLYITCSKSEVIKYDAMTLKPVKRFTVSSSGIDCGGSVLSSDYRYLVVKMGGRIAAVDTRTDKVIYEMADHDYETGIMSISHNNKMLATGGFDSRVNLYDLASGNKLASIYTPREKDLMITTGENYYLASKNTLDAISFSYNNTSYGFEQFDARFNRPDLVLKKMSRADSSLLNTYYAAYQKRLKKLHLNEKNLGAEVHLPVVRLTDKFTLRPATTLDEYELKIECFDASYPLKALHVLVNNCPLFGTGGKVLEDNKGRAGLSVKVPLSSGINIIRVFCTNSKGAHSLPESFEIYSNYKAEVKTYFIGIAVSGYKDSSMTLHFAAKDVRDLAASFGKMYRNFEADTLIDAAVTRENILALRSRLLNTTVNDRVIISVNGHGLLDDSLDFYYATWDNDFSNPAKRGLKYEDLEALLDGIPARKKLLLIDACHSGALDKEELLSARNKKEEKGRDTGPADSIKGFVSRGGITRSTKSKVDANSTYEMMQNLFADISAGNGAVVISAAGGMEYAYESDKWNNGVFTYCIRKGLEEELADKETGDLDGLVDVEELKQYVSNKVSELTKGKQRPVSRRENIDYKWIIW